MRNTIVAGVIITLVILMGGCAAPVSVPSATPTQTSSSPSVASSPTPAPTPTTPTTYEVSLTTDPTGAHVWLNGNDTGKVTPFTFIAEPGENTVVAKLDGYQDCEWRIKVTNTNMRKFVTLTKTFETPKATTAKGKIAFFSDRDGNKEIYIMNVDGSEQVRLTNNQANDWSPSFSHDGSKIGFHTDRDGNHAIYTMNVDGSDQVMLKNNPPEEPPPSFSPDRSKIVIESDWDGNPEIYIVNVDESEQVDLFLYLQNVDESDRVRLTNNPARDSEPFFSPDGSKIAFTSDRDGNEEIYLMNVDGSDQVRLTNNPANDWASSFSPDESTATVTSAKDKIVFLSERIGNNAIFSYGPFPTNDIYIMNVDGSEQIRLTNHPEADIAPSFSPDGSKIVFESYREGNVGKTYIMNIDGSDQVKLIEGDCRSPSFSPDGSKIAFASKYSIDDGYLEICIMNVDGSEWVNLTNNPAFDYAPVFSPDGSKIAFYSNRDGNEEIYVMKVDGSGQARLTNNLAGDWSPSFSPDGSKIAFMSDRDGDNEIYIMNANGSEQVNLSNSPADDGDPSFSPDGSKIVFASKRDGTAEIYIMNVDGSEQVRITNNLANDWDPSFSPSQSNTSPPTRVTPSQSPSPSSTTAAFVPWTGPTTSSVRYVNEDLTVDPEWRYIRLRSGPDRNNFSEISRIQAKEPVDFFGNIIAYGTWWAYVKYQGKEGYVPSNFLNNGNAPMIEWSGSMIPETWSVKENLSLSPDSRYVQMRNGPGTEFLVTLKIPQKDSVRFFGTSFNAKNDEVWAYVQYQGQYGWVLEDLLIRD